MTGRFISFVTVETFPHVVRTRHQQQRTMAIHAYIIFYFKPLDRESNNKQYCADRHDVTYVAEEDNKGMSREESVRGSGRLQAI